MGIPLKSLPPHLQALYGGAPKRSKYNAKKTELDGIIFDSGAEAKRYAELKQQQLAGFLDELSLQPKYPFAVNGTHCFTYKGDFRYRRLPSGVWVVEDVKGVRTPIYRLKKKLIEAAYGIQIKEIS